MRLLTRWASAALLLLVPLISGTHAAASPDDGGVAVERSARAVPGQYIVTLAVRVLRLLRHRAVRCEAPVHVRPRTAAASPPCSPLPSWPGSARHPVSRRSRRTPWSRERAGRSLPTRAASRAAVTAASWGLRPDRPAEPPARPGVQHGRHRHGRHRVHRRHRNRHRAQRVRRPRHRRLRRHRRRPGRQGLQRPRHACGGHGRRCHLRRRALGLPRRRARSRLRGQRAPGPGSWPGSTGSPSTPSSPRC